MNNKKGDQACLKKVDSKQLLNIECEDEITTSASSTVQSSGCSLFQRCSPGLDVRSEKSDNLCLPNHCKCDYGLPPKETSRNLFLDFY